MKRFGTVEGTLVCLCVVGFNSCGGRTQTDWDSWQSGGTSSGGTASGGKPITPKTGGAGGVPTSGGRAGMGGVSTSGGRAGTGGTGLGGKAPTTGGTSGGAMAAGGSAIQCMGSAVLCGNTCVNLQSDPNHCGDCARGCGDSGCVNGACVAKCPAPLLTCATRCVDPTQDENFCGAFGTCSGPESGQRCAASEQCRFGRCEPATTNCLSILNAGNSHGDDYYAISPGLDPAQVDKAFCDMTREGGGWTRCFQVTNTQNEDLNDNTWFNRCVDWMMSEWSHGELLLELRDANGVLVYIATGKRNSSWTYDTLTSSAVPNSQAYQSSHNPIPLSTSDLLWITSRSASNQGCVGAQGNGYGILLTPGSLPQAETLFHLLVMPYRLQVGSHEPRQFGFDNLQWFPSNEISFGAMTPFGTCDVPTPFLGSFDFYVR